MRHLGTICGLAFLLAAGNSATAQEVPDLVGTWIPTEGAHILEGPTLHHESGTEAVEDADGLHRHTSTFVFEFEGQDGRTFWGKLSSGEVSERLVGAISVDGKRFVIADHDGSFSGTVVDADTLDYCYVHSAPTNSAVACGLLVREQ